jgi:hypothetical protein
MDTEDVGPDRGRFLVLAHTLIPLPNGEYAWERDFQNLSGLPGSEQEGDAG